MVVAEYANRWALLDWHGALLWTKARNARGIKCALDILGEHVKDEDEMLRSKAAYLALIRSISSEKLFASATIKPSSLGHSWDKYECLQSILELADAATKHKVGFEIDMEGRSMVGFTLDAAKACANTGFHITVALQAYLDRTPSDMDSMLDNKVRVRLVKGAYAGDTSDFMDIQGRFKALVRRLAESGASFAIGTHDPDLIVWATVKMQNEPERIEFGLLKGLADKTKLEFVANKWRVSEYVPFGENKVAYEDRRRAYLAHLAALGRSPAP